MNEVIPNIERIVLNISAVMQNTRYQPQLTCVRANGFSVRERRIELNVESSLSITLIVLKQAHLVLSQSRAVLRSTKTTSGA